MVWGGHFVVCVCVVFSDVSFMRLVGWLGQSEYGLTRQVRLVCGWAGLLLRVDAELLLN